MSEDSNERKNEEQIKTGRRGCNIFRGDDQTKKPTTYRSEPRKPNSRVFGGEIRSTGKEGKKGKKDEDPTR